MTQSTAVDVRQYHDQTKHRFSGWARGPDTLDWDAQPVAFRRYEGAPLTHLPLAADGFTQPFSSLFADGRIAARPLSLENIALLLEMSLAVSAWKAFGGSRWALRCNPSSGNLHPTEAYLLFRGIEGVADGLYHYRADEHGLEQRCRFGTGTSQPEALLLGLSSVHWREAWKYGERAYRYCQLDVGHALAAISYAAATLGWRVIPHYEVADERLAQLLGIDRRDDFPKGSEQEHPDLLLSIVPDGEGVTLDSDALAQRTAQAQWSGKANILDRRHFYHWPIIDSVTQACRKAAHDELAAAPGDAYPLPLATPAGTPAALLFRRRRSAQAFDGVSGMTQQELFRTLDHLLPRSGLAPWNSQAWQARIHPVLFVHRVEGVEPGLYALPRTPQALALMKSQMDPSFLWQKVTSAPAHLPLYQLLPGKMEGIAIKLSCGQGIAGNGAFCMAMLAEFDAHVRDTPWRYRELHWEAGVLGQVLYLEAESNSLQGTGIGCFFDDGVHELLGMIGDELQVLYHFTVGKGLVDERITTLPAYERPQLAL